MSRARTLADQFNSDGDLALTPVASVNAGQIGGRRNLIINGDMQVAQRGTNHATSGYGSLDRWQLALSGGTATMSQESFTIGQTDVPGSEKYLKLVVTTGDNNEGIYHSVEARDLMPAIGEQVTLSYYAKGTSPTDGLDVTIAWYDGSTGSNATSETVTLTSSWVKYTHTFTTPSITGLNLASSNTNARLEIRWLQKSTDTGTAAFEVNLAQVQLEFGSQATDFEFRSYGEELILCQRFYQKHGNETSAYRYLASAFCNQTTQAQGVLTLPVTMRVAPTTSVSGSFELIHGSTSTSITLNRKEINESSIGLEPAAGSGFTANSGAIIRASNDATAQLKLDAEF